MRIAVVNNFFPPRVGGSSHMASSLARGYAAAGHEVLVLTAAYRNAPERETRDGYQIVRLPSWTLPETRLSVTFDIGFTTLPSVSRRIRTILDEFQPDVIHQHGQFFDLTWWTGLYARRRGVPTLLSVHTRLESPIPLYRRVFRLLDGVMVAPILRLFKPRLVVMDVHMDEYIHDRYSHALSGLEYIPVGVDPVEAASGDGPRIRERLGLGNRPVIMSVGHVIPLRDRVRLVRALPRVLEKIPDVAVVVVGGVYYDEFLGVADELGVRSAIHVIGPVPKAEIPDYLAAGDLECHDLDGFGLGTASLESMAAGCPVVAGLRPDNFPGIELRNREHLYLTPPGDEEALAEALVEVLADPAHARATVGSDGQRLVRERFSLTSITNQYLTALSALVSTRQDRSAG